MIFAKLCGQVVYFTVHSLNVATKLLTFPEERITKKITDTAFLQILDNNFEPL